MFMTLYDREFKALGKWTTYLCASWTLKRKAFEFDELNLTTRTLENSNDAVYVGLHENTGRLKYLAFCGKPVTKDNKTTINAVDLKQIFKQQLMIDLTNVAATGVNKVKQLYSFLLNMPAALSNNDFSYSVNLSELDAVAVPFVEESIVRTKEVRDLWELIQAANSLYDIYIETNANIVTKTIEFKVRIVNGLIRFKMSDFGEPRVTNNTTVTNRVMAINLAANTKETYYLLSNDLIVTEEDAELAYERYIIQPPRYETVTDTDDLNKASAAAVEKLAGNRFQSKVEVSTETPAGAILRTIDLNYFADIYGFNAADDTTVKRLPAMAIEESHTGALKVTFGRLSSFWF